MLIVGWDDDKDAWRIKNSWGDQNWGEKGYMWLRYRSNYIGFGAAWVDAFRRPVSANVSRAQDSAKTINTDQAKAVAKTLSDNDVKFKSLPASQILKTFGIKGIKF